MKIWRCYGKHSINNSSDTRFSVGGIVLLQRSEGGGLGLGGGVGGGDGIMSGRGAATALTKIMGFGDCIYYYINVAHIIASGMQLFILFDRLK